MRRLRVAVLTHEDLVPPDNVESLDPQQRLAFQTEWDVQRTLCRMGHDARYLGVSSDLLPIRELLEEWKPHIVFNLLMEFQDVAAFQAHVVSYLELLGVAYTGCNPRGILLSRDKALSKKILRYHRIPTPSFAVFEPDRKVKLRRDLHFPLIVKSLDEEASFGIAQASVVRDAEQLDERVRFIHDHVGGDAIAEEYIDGREITISVLGNRRLETFPIWEMHFRNLPDGNVPIATARVKWDKAYQERLGIFAGPADGLESALVDRIHRMARRIYRALGLSGYARVDMRLAPDGRVFVLEANATPDIKEGEDLAESAWSVGVEYPALLQRILNLGRRYQPHGKRE